MLIKEVLFIACKGFVDERLETIQSVIRSNKLALASETKSSAGDKHETGRAMLQLEMEKAAHQLQSVQTMKDALAKIDVSKISKIAHLGSVVETNKGVYFLSISAGKITVQGKDYFAVSIASPIGKSLLGKKEKDEFVFNGKHYIIKVLS